MASKLAIVAAFDVASIDVAARDAPTSHLISLVNAWQRQDFEIALIIPHHDGKPAPPLDDKTLAAPRRRWRRMTLLVSRAGQV